MKAYIEQNRERFFEELFSLLRIPSISAKPEYKPDMYRCARRLTELLVAAGADKAAVYETKGNPVVYGVKTVPGAAKTVLVYGHYDVQPPEPLEKWRTDPFQPVLAKDPATGEEAIYARGANDDKGQLFMHLKAFEFLLKKGLLRHNVKFIFEGEEEVGSPSLAAWAEEHKDLLKADIILVSDTTMISEKVPSINCGNTLCAMIASLHDADGRVTVPGFYDDVVELSAEDRAMLARAPFDMDEYKAFLDINEVKGEKGYTTLERVGIRPCLDVCGIWGGYTGKGAKTVLPSTAHAKISMRLVPNQTSAKITELFEKHFRAICPPYAKVDVQPCEGGNGFLIPITSDGYKAAAKAMAEVYGIEPVPSRGGGSIAVLADLQRILGIDPLLMGFGLERDTIHSPNESYLLRQLFAGMESIALFYQYY